MAKVTSSAVDRIIKTIACFRSDNKALSGLHINKTAQISLAFVTVRGLQTRIGALFISSFKLKFSE